MENFPSFEVARRAEVFDGVDARNAQTVERHEVSVLGNRVSGKHCR